MIPVGAQPARGPLLHPVFADHPALAGTAIRHAEADDLAGCNVAALVKSPQGRSGRPSKSFTLAQAKALLAAAEGTRLDAYVVLSLLVGIRTEEARALRWDHVVTWVDDSAGWQPITTAGFDPAGVGEDR